ncbi:hypothetical protein MRB53_025672 [Persea americana]|uniref:Uncharacterized protein n=1 Tax=Persea americana TaxID=3435 RepID=A0ACC2LFV6_PERAE|nr:hypothetical protein MRB53_025672 [Persea americana]
MPLFSQNNTEIKSQLQITINCSIPRPLAFPSGWELLLRQHSAGVREDHAGAGDAEEFESMGYEMGW